MLWELGVVWCEAGWLLASGSLQLVEEVGGGEHAVQEQYMEVHEL